LAKSCAENQNVESWNLPKEIGKQKPESWSLPKEIRKLKAENWNVENRAIEKLITSEARLF
jgi:hypothetical protein